MPVRVSGQLVWRAGLPAVGRAFEGPSVQSPGGRRCRSRSPANPSANVTAAPMKYSATRVSLVSSRASRSDWYPSHTSTAPISMNEKLRRASHFRGLFSSGGSAMLIA